MPKSVLETFALLNSSVKDSLADTDSALVLALSALELGNSEAGMERMSIEHIVACLEAAGVDVKKRSIQGALASSRGCVSSMKDISGETTYKLMTKGKRKLEDQLGGDLTEVIRIESGTPRTARLRLGDMFSTLKGTVRICDPYYGTRTLDALDHIPTTCQIRFLSANTSEGAAKIKGAFTDFVKERPKTEFRKITGAPDIHDRYVVTAAALLLIGHGLKDVGGKESFMVRLDKDVVPDLIKEVKSSFDARWASAVPIV